MRRFHLILGLVVVVVFLLTGFFLEPGWGPEKTSIAPLGIFAIGIGTLLHLLSAGRPSHTQQS